jgi:hypothetical protein
VGWNTRCGMWWLVGQLVLGPSGCPTVPLIHHLTKRLLVRHPPLPDSCVTRRLHTLSSHGHVPWHAHSPRCMCGWRLSAYSPFLWIERGCFCVLKSVTGVQRHCSLCSTATPYFLVGYPFCRSGKYGNDKMQETQEQVDQVTSSRA